MKKTILLLFIVLTTISFGQRRIKTDKLILPKLKNATALGTDAQGRVIKIDAPSGGGNISNSYEEGVIPSNTQAVQGFGIYHTNSPYIRIGNIVFQKIRLESVTNGYTTSPIIIGLKFPVIEHISGRVILFKGSNLSEEKISNLDCVVSQNNLRTEINFRMKDGSAIGGVSFVPTGNNGIIELYVVYKTNVYNP